MAFLLVVFLKGVVAVGPTCNRRFFPPLKTAGGGSSEKRRSSASSFVVDKKTFASDTTGRRRVCEERIPTASESFMVRRGASKLVAWQQGLCVSFSSYLFCKLHSRRVVPCGCAAHCTRIFMHGRDISDPFSEFLRTPHLPCQ